MQQDTVLSARTYHVSEGGKSESEKKDEFKPNHKAVWTLVLIFEFYKGGLKELLV